MSLIFISHSSQDRAAATELRDRLQADGFSSEGSLFLDFDGEHGIQAGQQWEQTLYRQVRACRAVIVLCSRASMASRWCFMEITHARALGKHLFPVKIDDCEVDGLLADHQLVDLTTNKDDGYRRILGGIADAGLDPRDAFFWDGRRPPYPGLLAYQEADAAVFFGREEEIAEGLDLLNRCRRLGDARLVMVLGASGSGKSSVVRAGLVPRLRRDVERWLVVDPIRPENDPVNALADALSRAFERAGVARAPEDLAAAIRDAVAASADTTPGGAALADIRTHEERMLAGRLVDLERLIPDTPTLESVRRHLRLAREDLERVASDTVGASPISTNRFFDLVAALRRANRRDGATVLLILDQFEELLDRPAGHPAHTVLRLLRGCLERPGEPIVVLGTLRADFLGTLQACTELAGIRAEPLSLRSVRYLEPSITKTAATAGIELEPGLVEALVADAQGPEALPLLAFALRELYDRVGERTKVISLRDYRDIGGLDGAVAQSAGQLVANVDADMLALLRQSLLRLARVTDDGHVARRTVQWIDLDPLVHALLQRFVDARLLVSDERGGQRVLEVAHEALFRSWETLRRWLQESSEDLRLRRDLEASAQSWDRAGRSAEYLWRGGRLAAAIELGGSLGAALTVTERTFLTTSYEIERTEHDRAERGRRRQLRRARVAVTVVSGLLVGAIYLYYQTTQERNVALGQKLAADSAVLRGNIADWTVPALLAIESLRRAETVQGYEALWHASSVLPREPVRLPDAPGEPRHHFMPAVMFSVDGKTLAVATDDPLVRVFDVSSSRELARIPLSGDVRSITFTRDGSMFAAWSVPSADDPFTISVVDLATQRQLARVAGTGAVAFSDDGRYLAVGSDKTASLYLARSGDAVATFPIGAHVRSLAISPDNALLAVGSEDNKARVFDIASGRQRFAVEYGQFMSLETGVRALAFSPNSKLLASASVDAELAQVSDVATGATEARLVHPAAVRALAFSPDSKSVVSGASDNMARVFTTVMWRETLRIAFAHPVERVSFSLDGRHVIAASRLAVRVADLRTGIERIRFENLQRIGAVAFNPDGQLFAAGAERSARVFTLQAPNEVEPKLTEPGPPMSPDGLTVTVGKFGKGAAVIDARTRQLVAALDLGDAQFRGACFTAGGSQIVAASQGKNPSQNHQTTFELTAFESRTGRIVWRNINTSESAWRHRHECSPDGQVLAVATERQVLLVNAATGRTSAPLEHEEVTSVAFNRDGTRLATGADDGYAHIYLVKDAREIARMPLGESVQRVEFEPDGRRLRVTTGGADRDREIWIYRSSLEPIEAADLIADACTRLARNLTPNQWATFIGGTPRKTCPGLAREAAATATPAR